MVAPGYGLILLLYDTGGPALTGGSFRLRFPHHTRMDTPIPEVHPPGDPFPDLLGPADAQRLYEDNVGKDKGSLGVPTPVDYPLPFHNQDVREAAPYCFCWRGKPDN